MPGGNRGRDAVGVKEGQGLFEIPGRSLEGKAPPGGSYAQKTINEIASCLLNES
jgi:hypothetical protein